MWIENKSREWQRQLISINFADPFADAAKGDEDGVQDGLVHIRIQQRNGRKTLTTIQGLSSEYDLKKIVRACKKVSHPDKLGHILSIIHTYIVVIWLIEHKNA